MTDIPSLSSSIKIQPPNPGSYQFRYGSFKPQSNASKSFLSRTPHSGQINADSVPFNNRRSSGYGSFGASGGSFNPAKQSFSFGGSYGRDAGSELANRHSKEFSRTAFWSEEEHSLFVDAFYEYGRDWEEISKFIGTRDVNQVKRHAQLHLLYMWAKGQELPRRVKESGRGYTVCGQELNEQCDDARAFVKLVEVGAHYHENTKEYKKVLNRLMLRMFNCKCGRQNEDGELTVACATCGALSHFSCASWSESKSKYRQFHCPECREMMGYEAPLDSARSGATSPRIDVQEHMIKAEPETEKEPEELQPVVEPGGSKIQRGFLFGQLANVCVFGAWWVLFSPIVLSLFGDLGVGASRIAYNLALFVVSPFAGALAERLPIRRLLNITASTRFFVYSIAIPLAWVLLRSGWVVPDSESYVRPLFLIIFLSLIVVDGISVAVSNVIGMDCGGLDLLSQQHSIGVDDELRNKYNSLHQGFFDGSMVVLSPVMAIAGLWTSNTMNSQSGGMVGIMALGVGILSIIMLVFYNMRIPKAPSANRPPAGSWSEEMAAMKDNIVAGLRIFVGHRQIRWRIMFLALETAIEDAMVILVLAEFSIRVIAKGDYALGNVYVNILVAIGKVGSILAAVFMNKWWQPSEDHSSYRWIFYFTFAGGLSALLIPAGLLVHYNVESADGFPWLSSGIVVIGSFAFFLLTTIPKIGFATLLQGLVSQEDASGRIFGFAASLITAADSAILMGLSAIFSWAGLSSSIYVACGFFAAVGIFQGIFGPSLVLSTNETDEEKLLSA